MQVCGICRGLIYETRVALERTQEATVFSGTIRRVFASIFRVDISSLRERKRMAGVTIDPRATRPRRHFSIARVMFWIACGSVALASSRAQDLLPVLVCVLTAFVLVGDLLFTATQLATGERPAIRWGSSVPRRIHASGGFWAMGESCPIPVDLITWPRFSDEEVTMPPIVDIKIEGRYYLRVRAADQDEPLKLTTSEPVLVRHKRYGPCLVVKLSGA
jgi:hypothetical protein